ncbi:Scr1 family TA system antitoxin-like transcriptional regulator [Couchioplanes caeruleus]|uniref:Scr1 family TA system antitoxin-like transcriptional regulator n=1 Tax=Couchioplanes caeruleus TaxID=56438 RepID=UPI003D31C2AC
MLQTEAFAQAIIQASCALRRVKELSSASRPGCDAKAFRAKQDPVARCGYPNEAANRCTVGRADGMQELLGHHVPQAKLPTMALQILPYGEDAHPGMAGAFLGMTPQRNPPLVYAKARAGACPSSVARGVNALH